MGTRYRRGCREENLQARPLLGALRLAVREQQKLALPRVPPEGMPGMGAAAPGEGSEETEGSAAMSWGKRFPKGGRKLDFYCAGPELAEMRAEAKRLGRPLAWVMQRAWRLARGALRQRPSVPR